MVSAARARSGTVRAMRKSGPEMFCEFKKIETVENSTKNQTSSLHHNTTPDKERTQPVQRGILSLSNLSPPHSKKTPHQRHHPPRRHPHSLGLAILKAGQHVLHLHALLALLLELFCQLLHLRGKREKKKRVWGFSGANLFWWAWDAHLLLRRGARHTDHARRPP